MLFKWYQSIIATSNCKYFLVKFVMALTFFIRIMMIQLIFISI